MWEDSKRVGGSSSRAMPQVPVKTDPFSKAVVRVPNSNQTEAVETAPASAVVPRRGDDGHIDDKVFLSFHEVSVALSLPEPYVTQRNTKLVLVEDYVRLASIIKSEPFDVRPLGYFKSPDGFDIYVFECTLGSLDRPSHLKRWKIHRRYRHFDLLLSRLMDMPSASSMRWPSLSWTYIQMFRAKHCKDRMVELHSWLVKAIGMLQSMPVNDAAEKVAMQFTCFLFAAANTPYVTFPLLPLFAWANEQVNVRLSSNGPALYPSRVPNQHAADSGGLGLRLAPSTGRVEDANVTIYRGAVVTGFLRDSFDVPNVQFVRLGSHLSHINGVPVENETFETILVHLRNVARPMHLTFTYDPRPQVVDHPMSELDLRRHDRLLSTGSVYSTRTSAASSMDATEVQTPMNVLGSVLNETFGGSRKRTETLISITSDDNNQDEDEILCWDDISGLIMDTVTSGFYYSLPPATTAPPTPTPPPVQETSGIWSTSAGPLKVLFSGCKLRGKQAVFLSATPQRFGPLSGPQLAGSQSSSRRGKKQPPEVRLERGMVLVSVNGKSTFDLSFYETIALVAQASVPTALCFRWFNDYSLFLNPNSDQAMPLIHRPSAQSGASPLSTEAEIACLVQAQTKLSGLLHQALTENASLRVELQVVQESNRHLREDNSTASKAHSSTAQDAEKLIRRCNQLQAALGAERVEVQQTTKELRKAEKSVRDVDSQFQVKLAHAHELAAHRAKAHEERCIEESRKSIEVAKRAAEARTKRQVEEALAAQRRQSNLEMQRLAEDNGEEIEFLNQQLALWKHQVEVLTENDKRKHRSANGSLAAPKMSEDEEVLDQDRRRRSNSRDDREDATSFWGRVFDPATGDTP